MSKVLGDELAAGIVEVARNDIQVGGITFDELLQNWTQASLMQSKNFSSQCENSPRRCRSIRDKNLQRLCASFSTSICRPLQCDNGLNYDNKTA